MLKEYTKQESRIAKSFSGGGTCTTTHCENCERVYFVTSPGHGDYSEGELGDLRQKATEDYSYIEVPDFSSVDTMFHPVNGKQIVVGCVCDPTRNLVSFIEDNAKSLTRYLSLYWEDKWKESAEEAENSLLQMRKLGWRPMDEAPKDASEIIGYTKTGEEVVAHWASDFSGEEQPAFHGWFMRNGDGFFGVSLVKWKPIPKCKNMKDQLQTKELSK